MIQLLLLGVALCASIYGALNGSLPSLLIATIMTLLGSVSLYGNPSRQQKARQAIAGNFAANSWLIVCVVAVFLASLATRRALDDAFDFTSGYFWLAGMVLVILAAYVHDYYQRRWLFALSTTQSAIAKSALFDRLDWSLVALITAVALYLRLHNLTDFLPTMHGDEGEMGMLALLALHGPASGVSPLPLPLFSTAFLDHPTLFHYLQAGAIWLFGESLVSGKFLRIVNKF